jgi:hypothetical protein
MAARISSARATISTSFSRRRSKVQLWLSAISATPLSATHHSNMK